MTRREFLGTVIAGSAVEPVLCRAAAPGVHLIAHRGGVVDEQRSENSAAAISAAIERGYWMVEVDVRRSRDGEPVLYHDSTLQRYYADTRRIEDLTWAELRKLKTTHGGGPPLHFEQACAMCKGNMRLMLDLKAADWPREFHTRLLRTIEDAGVPGPIYSLGGERVKPLFDGRVMVSASRQSLRAAAEAGRPVNREYFLFELGSDLDAAAVSLCRELSVVPVAAINTFRYTMARRDEWQGPMEDVAKLRRLGVVHFQVDSRYERLFV